MRDEACQTPFDGVDLNVGILPCFDFPLKISVWTICTQALETAERKAKPSLGSMFEDVYEVVPPHLQEQEHQLHAHLERNAGRYDGAGG